MNGVTGFNVREIVRKAGIVQPQGYVVRTIEPIVAANTGIRAVDAGMPQLSMHSCREVAMCILDRKYFIN
jgi:aspartyl aminopeptidase